VPYDTNYNKSYCTLHIALQQTVKFTKMEDKGIQPVKIPLYEDFLPDLREPQPNLKMCQLDRS